MTFNFLNEIQNARERVVMLQPVDKIDLLGSLDPSIEVCEFESSLSQNYHKVKVAKSNFKCIDKCILTVLHSIYQGRKLVFGISRDTLKAIYENNPNLKEESFSSSAYKHLTIYMESLGILQLVMNSGSQCRIYYVSESFKYKNYIKGNVKSQLKSALEFREPKLNHTTEELEKLLCEYPDLRELVQS